MPGPKPPQIELSEVEKSELEKLVSRYTTGQQKAQRGRIILKAAAGESDSAIVRDLKVSMDMVRLWRRRWLLLQPISMDDLIIEERLEDLPRPGAPARITADQRCQMEQMACESPEKVGRPISQWTGREIAAEVVTRGVVATISARHAARLLKKGGCNRTGSVTG
jgi:putative transposase